MIIEDEAAYLRLLVDELRITGGQIFVSNNGQEGIELAITLQPHLILLDLQLPKVSGLTMLQQIKSSCPQSQVIILTNIEPDDSIINTVLTYQPYLYYLKCDTSLKELQEKINQLLSVQLRPANLPLL